MKESMASATVVFQKQEQTQLQKKLIKWYICRMTCGSDTWTLMKAYKKLVRNFCIWYEITEKMLQKNERKNVNWIPL